MLNPDGVVRGHYRTDSRGVNLNRMYLDPNFDLYPSIYASKSVLVYHHVHNRVIPQKLESPKVSTAAAHEAKQSVASASSGANGGRSSSKIGGRTNMFMATTARTTKKCPNNSVQVTSTKTQPNKPPLSKSSVGNSAQTVKNSKQAGAGVPRSESWTDAGTDGTSGPKDYQAGLSRTTGTCTTVNVFSLSSFGNEDSSPNNDDVPDQLAQKLSRMNLSSEHSLVSDISLGLNQDFVMESSNDPASGGEFGDPEDDNPYDMTEHLGNEGSEDEGENNPPITEGLYAPHLSDLKLKEIPPNESGIAYYIDLHGHASKRGCFMYGNALENEEQQVENVLFTKLIAMNTAHFDFYGCNFTERNMYLKDKRDGLSKEGAGRVAVYKALGIVHR